VSLKIKYLMLVPSANPGNEFGRRPLSADGADIIDLARAHGYHLLFMRSKYLDAMVEKYAINPTYYFMFELQDSSASLN
jgi:hypothetical protein